MISWLRRSNGEQRKLILSLSASFLSRIPGLVGLLWFLPLLFISLGTEQYANMLAAMALGGVGSFLASGFNLIGRRAIGEAYANGDRVGEANALASAIVANILAAAVSITCIAAFCWIRGETSEYLIIAALAVFGSFLMLFENVRLAYNEYYVTAIYLIVIQSTGYLLGFLIPSLRHDILIGSLILSAAYWLSSLTTFLLMLHKRPYLLRGRANAVAYMVRQGTVIAMADGFMFATLNLSVVWIQGTAPAETAAWFATTVRLFQTFLVPVSLLMSPLSSYIRLRWCHKSFAEQQVYTKITLALGLCYGALVSVALFVISQLYIGQLLHLSASGTWTIYLLFGAIIAYKSYSSVAYMVLDESTHLSSWITASLGASVALSAVASLTVNPMGVIDVYAMTAGVSILVVLLWNAARFVRPGVVAA